MLWTKCFKRILEGELILFSLREKSLLLCHHHRGQIPVNLHWHLLMRIKFIFFLSSASVFSNSLPIQLPFFRLFQNFSSLLILTKNLNASTSLLHHKSRLDLLKVTREHKCRQGVESRSLQGVKSTYFSWYLWFPCRFGFSYLMTSIMEIFDQNCL